MNLAHSMANCSSSHARYLAGSRSADEERKKRYAHLGPVKRATKVELDSTRSRSFPPLFRSITLALSCYSIPEGDEEEEGNDEEVEEEQHSALRKKKNKSSQGIESIQTRFKGISSIARQAKIGTASMVRQFYSDSEGRNVSIEVFIRRNPPLKFCSQVNSGNSSASVLHTSTPTKQRLRSRTVDVTCV